MPTDEMNIFKQGFNKVYFFLDFGAVLYIKKNNLVLTNYWCLVAQSTKSRSHYKNTYRKTLKKIKNKHIFMQMVV